MHSNAFINFLRPTRHQLYWLYFTPVQISTIGQREKLMDVKEMGTEGDKFREGGTWDKGKRNGEEKRKFE